MAPIAGWAAVVDGVNLPDVPYYMFTQGRMNVSPKGEKISVIMGTNEDELALFAAAMPFVIPGVSLPISGKDLVAVADHLVKYHDNWNASVALQIPLAYPMRDYHHQSDRMVAAGTDFCFRCGTRQSARALSAQGVPVDLYNFNFHFHGYIDPKSEFCYLDDELLCGVYHSSELKYVFDNLGPFVGDADRRVAGYFGKYWTNMAKYGTPNAPAGQGTNAQEYWPAYNISTDLHLEITDTLSVQSGLAKVRCDFWDTLPKQGVYPH
jgi:carboxylesterase type B